MTEQEDAGEDAHVYVLFEHKSQPDSLISWYLLSCMVRIWRQDMKMSKNKKLRVIIPVVVYHGTEEWTAGLNFQDLFRVLAEGVTLNTGGKKMGYNFLESVLTYISSATDRVDEAYLGSLVEGLNLDKGDEIMPTLVEKWVEKGSQRMARELVAELLEIRFGNRPPQILIWLNQLTDVPTLKMLHRQAATAQSIGEFEKFLKSTIQSSSDRSSEILTA